VNLPPINLKALAIAFAAELGADFLISLFVFGLFAGDLLRPGMNESEFAEVARQVRRDTPYVAWMMMLGIGTTVGGAWFAARLAKRIPYYHGLAMGILGLLYLLVTWNSELGWLNFLWLVIVIPASLYGAHLAKKTQPVD
jgi:hypothetical protein